MNFTMTHTFESQAIEVGSYNLLTNELTLVIKGKVRKDQTRSLRTYVYPEVPAYVWDDLVEQDSDEDGSAGRFWIEVIQVNYGKVPAVA